MLEPGRKAHATSEGRHASVGNAITAQSGASRSDHGRGNGPNVTCRLAARYAAELNLDGMSLRAAVAHLA